MIVIIIILIGVIIGAATTVGIILFREREINRVENPFVSNVNTDDTFNGPDEERPEQ